MGEGRGAPEPHSQLELALAVLMALAAVGTAWAGFQSSKWSGVQANSYAQAGATRIESDRASTEAGQERTIDIVTFGSWLNALDDLLLEDPSADLSASYQPDDGGVNGFLFVRFRDEFRPAMDAWLALDPFQDHTAPTTPFGMPEYQLAADERAHALALRADELSGTARTANQRSDNYVLTAVIFALVLFFSGVATRTAGLRAKRLLFVLGLLVLLAAAGILLTLPVTI